MDTKALSRLSYMKLKDHLLGLGIDAAEVQRAAKGKQSLLNLFDEWSANNNTDAEVDALDADLSRLAAGRDLSGNTDADLAELPDDRSIREPSTLIRRNTQFGIKHTNSSGDVTPLVQIWEEACTALQGPAGASYSEQDFVKLIRFHRNLIRAARTYQEADPGEYYSTKVSSYCNRCIVLITTTPGTSGFSAECRVTEKRVLGDCYRYLSETFPFGDSGHVNAIQTAAGLYNEGYAIAKQELAAHSDARLALAVNVGMFFKYDEMVGDPQAVYDVAAEALMGCSDTAHLVSEAGDESLQRLGELILAPAPKA